MVLIAIIKINVIIKYFIETESISSKKQVNLSIFFSVHVIVCTGIWHIRVPLTLLTKVIKEEQILYIFPSPCPRFGGHLFQRCWRSKDSEECSILCQYIHFLYYFFSSCHYICLRANLARKASVRARADLSKHTCKGAYCAGILVPALLLKPVFHCLPRSVVWSIFCMCMRRKTSYAVHKFDM